MLDRVAEGRDPIKPRELAAVWRGDLAGAGAALDLDAEAVNEPGPHPVWGGRPDPLQLAAERGRAEIARLLLARGAPLESVAPRGGTALDSALGRGLRGRSVAALLIERGARPDPCQLAALGWTERLLRRIDADPAALSFRGRIGLNEVVGTPLHAAVHAGHGVLAAVLIARGADVDARADMGQRPLHLCAAAGLARLLVEAGADPAAMDDEHGTAPLTWARVGLEIHGDGPARRRLVDYLEQVTPGVG